MKICIENKDRHGLVYDISKILLKYNINILSMEVIKNTTYLETEALSYKIEQRILAELNALDGIINIKPIMLMPHDEKYQQMDIIFNTINEGIVIANNKGEIIYINKAAISILKVDDKSIIGETISKVLPFCKLLSKTLATGKKYLHHEVYSEEYNNHYMVSSQPILDENGNLFGGVAVIRDMKTVRQIYQKITGQPSTSFNDIIHQSQIMEELILSAQHYASSNSTILIRGETGSGKELFARAIHNASSRRNNIFLAINCTAIPDTLLESELFGYEEGTFTGANKGGKLGLFELACDGTLFLDEIGDISSTLQAKLLRVLQEHTVRRIGGSREIPINVRIISATNRNLEEMVQNDMFRQDLYYRLNVIPLYLPPLRERREDIALLANYLFNSTVSDINPSVKTLSPEAIKKLESYDYPGNVRELSNIIERAINMARKPVITPDDIIFSIQNQPINTNNPNNNIIDFNLNAAVKNTEKRIIREALKEFNSSRKLGAALGISHTSIIRKMKEYNLHFKE
ncbi:sigma 54-interacting transcriptional regulator [Megamonas hypermegale]|uniref:sigma 54-interacting transcriptional regulator n=1 Tax=Megamonas hypermegale TaxID=158847 RepID=UPI001958396B|nr:sigma 54-interacting transcriptional regulator [Megamonas hypermegale]MBM6834057.1 sigma 54-interacting transcriptional regulator [Megamonas hypermegale]